MGRQPQLQMHTEEFQTNRIHNSGMNYLHCLILSEKKKSEQWVLPTLRRRHACNGLSRNPSASWTVTLWDWLPSHSPSSGERGSATLFFTKKNYTREGGSTQLSSPPLQERTLQKCWNPRSQTTVALTSGLGLVYKTQLIALVLRLGVEFGSRARNAQSPEFNSQHQK